MESWKYDSSFKSYKKNPVFDLFELTQNRIEILISAKARLFNLDMPQDVLQFKVIPCPRRFSFYVNQIFSAPHGHPFTMFWAIFLPTQGCMKVINLKMVLIEFLRKRKISEKFSLITISILPLLNTPLWQESVCR